VELRRDRLVGWLRMPPGINQTGRDVRSTILMSVTDIKGAARPNTAQRHVSDGLGLGAILHFPSCVVIEP